MDREDITPELLRKLLRYEPETGELYWKSMPREMFATEGAMKAWHTKHANKKAFAYKTKQGYKQGRIRGFSFLAHRVAWAVYYGQWPKFDLDHINLKKGDNKITNLREVSHRENMYNRKIKSNNKTGYKGVCFSKKIQRYKAKITVGGIERHLGYFDCPKEAYGAYCKAAKKHHGEFANLG